METTKKLLDTREVYKSPVMEAIEVEVEQGFQMSAPSSPSSPNTYDLDYTY
jgi:hypothetical protein